MDLAALVHPMTVDEFLASTWGVHPHVFAGDTERFTELIDWPDLGELLSLHRHPHPRLRLSQEGAIVPRESYTRQTGTDPAERTLLAGNLYEHLRGGAMLVLDSLDEMVPAVRELALALESVFRERVVINSYAGWSEVEGFDLHWDDHDVIVLQVHGQKAWDMYGTTRPWPTRKDVVANDEPPSGPAETVVIGAGDVLYVPRGHWHRVHATQTPSLHLTIGVTCRTGYDFASWLAEDLLDCETFRRDIPRHASTEQRERYFQRIKDELSRRLTTESLERYLFVSDATAENRTRINLEAVHPDPAALTDASVLEWLAPRAVIRGGDGECVLSALGRVWHFAEPASAILRTLVSCRVLSLGELCAQVGPSLADPALIRSFVLELQTAGLVNAGSATP